MAEGPGFEPGFTESESVVLPLNDPPAFCFSYNVNESGKAAAASPHAPRLHHSFSRSGFNTTNPHHYQ